VVFAFENHPEKVDVQTHALACMAPLFAELFRQNAAIEVEGLDENIDQAEAEIMKEMEVEHTRLTRKREATMMPDGEDRDAALAAIKEEEEEEEALRQREGNSSESGSETAEKKTEPSLPAVKDLPPTSFETCGSLAQQIEWLFPLVVDSMRRYDAPENATLQRDACGNP